MYDMNYNTQNTNIYHKLPVKNFTCSINSQFEKEVLVLILIGLNEDYFIISNTIHCIK